MHRSHAAGSLNLNEKLLYGWTIDTIYAIRTPCITLLLSTINYVHVQVKCSRIQSIKCIIIIIIGIRTYVCICIVYICWNHLWSSHIYTQCQSRWNNRIYIFYYKLECCKFSVLCTQIIEMCDAIGICATYLYVCKTYIENRCRRLKQHTSSSPVPETVRFLGDSLANKACAIVLQID